MDTVGQRIAHIATQQHGLITRRQALEAGISARGIGRRLASGAFVQIERGAYRIGGAPITWHQRVLAACLAGPAVASHRSAARLWGFPVDRDDDIVEVTALRHRRRHVADVRWHESQRLEDRYLAEVDCIPLTTPVRTIIDLGVVLDADALEATLYTAMRMRMASIEGIERALDDLGELRLGRKQVRRVLKRARSYRRKPESSLETRFLQLIRDAGLPIPIPQYELRNPRGELVARVDFAYPDERLVIELDGARWHSIDPDKQRDRDREQRIIDLGNRVVRFTWKEVHDQPDDVVSKVRFELGLSQT